MRDAEPRASGDAEVTPSGTRHWDGRRGETQFAPAAPDGLLHTRHEVPRWPAVRGRPPRRGRRRARIPRSAAPAEHRPPGAPGPTGGGHSLGARPIGVELSADAGRDCRREQGRARRAARRGVGPPEPAGLRRARRTPAPCASWLPLHQNVGRDVKATASSRLRASEDLPKRLTACVVAGSPVPPHQLLGGSLAGKESGPDVSSPPVRGHRHRSWRSGGSVVAVDGCHRSDLLAGDGATYLDDRPGDLAAAVAGVGAVEGGAAPEDAVAAGEDEPVRVDDRRWADVAPVDPADRAGAGGRGAQDALGGVVVASALFG